MYTFEREILKCNNLFVTFKLLKIDNTWVGMIIISLNA